MIVSRGFRYRIYPTPEQETNFQHFGGVCRLVYNLALEQRRDFHRQYRRATGKCITVVSQCRELTALRAEVDWIAAVPVNVQQQALRDLDRAYANFFARRAGYRGQSAGVERGISPAMKREAKGHKARKTSPSGEAQLTRLRADRPAKRQLDQALAS